MATAGLTLAEVMVAIFVILVGVSGVTATIWWGLQKQDQGKLITEASNIGRIILENIMIQGTVGISPNITTWPTAATGLNDAPTDRREILAAPIPFSIVTTLTDHLGASSTSTHHNIFSDLGRFRRNITCQRLGPNNSTAAGRLCRLTVTIFYQDGAYEGRVVQEAVFPHAKQN
jgi:hypothetical protein